MSRPETCRVVLTVDIARKAVEIAETDTGISGISRSRAVEYLVAKWPPPPNEEPAK